jgi:hypothetical protein
MSSFPSVTQRRSYQWRRSSWSSADDVWLWPVFRALKELGRPTSEEDIDACIAQQRYSPPLSRSPTQAASIHHALEDLRSIEAAEQDTASRAWRATESGLALTEQQVVRQVATKTDEIQQYMAEAMQDLATRVPGVFGRLMRRAMSNPARLRYSRGTRTPMDRDEDLSPGQVP